MMITAGAGGEQVSLKKGDFFEANDMVLDFESNKTFEKPVITLRVEGNNVVMTTPAPLNALSMDTQKMASVEAGKNVLAGRT
jgi:hypothetical protein